MKNERIEENYDAVMVQTFNKLNVDFNEEMINDIPFELESVSYDKDINGSDYSVARICINNKHILNLYFCSILNEIQVVGYVFINENKNLVSTIEDIMYDNSINKLHQFYN